MTFPAVSIQNLQKHYGKTQALGGVNLEIREGEFFGLLGPNGAGKTTLISCIVGLVRPSVGAAEVFGHPVMKQPIEAKRCVGFSPQEVNVDRFFNLRRTLEFQGGFHGLPKEAAKSHAETLLRQFGLESKAKDPFYKLSGGMQKRLLVARALMGNPKLLILDEPTAGVDVEQRHDLWHYLRGLNRDGKTIILTTHYIDEAEALCERVGIINHGKIIELGSPKALIDKYCDPEVEIWVEGEIQAAEFSFLPKFSVSKNCIKAVARPMGSTIEKILSQLHSKPGRRLLDINIKRGDLETVFLKLTGKSLQKEAEPEKKSPALSLDREETLAP
jgi:ABC-2 type transport system ATP-binding protein